MIQETESGLLSVIQRDSIRSRTRTGITVFKPRESLVDPFSWTLLLAKAFLLC